MCLASAGDALAWENPKIKGQAPPARTLHFSAAVGGRIFIFGGGGADGNSPVSDTALYVLDTEAKTWERIRKPKGPVPSSECRCRVLCCVCASFATSGALALTP